VSQLRTRLCRLRHGRLPRHGRTVARESRDLGDPGVLATVYNTLHQFTEAGLLHETVVEPGRSYFDTNTADPHHFFCEASSSSRWRKRHIVVSSGTGSDLSQRDARGKAAVIENHGPPRGAFAGSMTQC
jgi:hypothetical protein